MASTSANEPKQKEAQNSPGESRRRALKRIATGAGVAAGAAALPGKWVKPVVDKVLIPAHAQTSATTTAEPIPVEFSGQFVMDMELNGISAGLKTDRIGQLARAILPEAHADPTPTTTYPPPSATGTLCIKSKDNGQKFDAKLLVEVTGNEFKETAALNGGGIDAYYYEIEGASVGLSVEFTSKVSCHVTTLNIPSVKILVDPFTTARAAFKITGYFAATGTLGEGTDCPVNPCPAASDIRLKSDIHALDRTDHGYQLYRFRYTDDPSEQAYVGVMAQDLIDSHPHAVVQNSDGFYAVRYDLLGIKMATYQEWAQKGLKAVSLIH